tara:strand:+ start:326 stop:649 length:324 start_codon:yes stop_codon:yes gene_type:complete
VTRAKVLQLGFLVLLLGGGSYWFFRVIGFEGVSAGIAAEALLVALVFAWTASYLLRVFTGQMTFVEQRKRYRAAYEKLTTTELQDKFQSLSEEEQLNLIQDLEREQH